MAILSRHASQKCFTYQGNNTIIVGQGIIAKAFPRDTLCENPFRGPKSFRLGLSMNHHIFQVPQLRLWDFFFSKLKIGSLGRSPKARPTGEALGRSLWARLTSFRRRSTSTSSVLTRFPRCISRGFYFVILYFIR